MNLIQEILASGVLLGVAIAIPVRAEGLELGATSVMGSPQITPAIAQIETKEIETLIEIRNVQVEETAGGATIALDTSGEAIALAAKTEGETTVLEIPNAFLSLANGNFVLDNPATGIARIEVLNLSGNRVRVTMTGVNAPPVTNVSTTQSALTIGVTIGPVANVPSSDEEEEIIVTREHGNNKPYFVPSGSTATGIDTPILETPASLQVIPRTILDDQQAIDLGDALRNTSGASVSSTEGRGFQINLRGFDGAPLFRDGFRFYSPNDNGDAAAQGFPEIANIEQIEILRGPTSILFGQVEPGGAVNIISKQPLAKPTYSVALQAGTDGLIRPQVDLSGPLSSKGNVLYRLNAVYQNEDGFRNYNQPAERFFIAPTIAWKINDRTDLTLRTEYLKSKRALDPGLVAFGTGIADIPRDRILGEPDDRVESDFLSLGYDLKHKFNDRWSIRNSFRYLQSNDDISATLSFPFIGGLNERTGILNRVFAEQTVSSKTLAMQTNVTGKFSTGPIEHTLLTGIDLASYDLVSDSFTSFALRTPINIFDPKYNLIARPARLSNPTSSQRIQTDTVTLYVQDRIKLLENLTLLAGLNYETVNQTTISTQNGATTERTLNNDAITPRIGLVYQPVKNLAFYANYSRSFYPSAALTVDGNPLDPEKGEGFEVGVKTELLNRRLLTTLSYFNLTKANVATADLNDPRFSVATGKQNSQGIELNAIGEITPSWNITASYAYIDAKVTEDNRIKIGNRLAGVPKHSASLWSTYKIQSGNLNGLGLGVGLNWFGERQGDLQNSFQLDSYLLTNAAIFYERNNWEYRLNFNNIFNVDYIQGTPRTRTRGIEAGKPFSVTGLIRYTF